MNILPNDQARHLFLHHHALTDAPSGPAKGADLAAVIDTIGFVQVDSINTVERAHHMILWARRQSYRPPALKRLLEHDRVLFEHWTHDASILPMRLFPYWRHRFARDEARLHTNWRKWFRDGYEAQFDTILDRIARDGPVTSADVGEGEERGKGGWWDWHPSKTALEWLWRTGRIAVSRRDGFRKVYDLTENVVPADLLAQHPSHAEMVEWACSSALENLGFATPTELLRYWNALEKPDVLHWIAAQKKAHRLIEIQVTDADGTLRAAVARPDVFERVAALPPLTPRLRVLSPFDPALRDRDRIEKLFGYHYRIEVFVPEPKRKYGYYVFPVIEGARLIGRVDAKAFKPESVLRVKGYWPEPGLRLTKAREAKLMAELGRLARLAGCERVEMLDGWLQGQP